MAFSSHFLLIGFALIKFVSGYTYGQKKSTGNIHDVTGVH